MDPWPDQWALLSSVSRLTPDAVCSLVSSLRPVAAGPEVTFAELAKTEGPAPPKVIKARLGAMLSIERAGLPPPVVAALKHLGSISNPEFFEKQRMRFSTWNTPRFIRCYREDLEWIHLPRGLTERVGELIVELGSTLDLTDDRTDPTPLDLGFSGSLRGPQEAAVADLVRHERGVLVAPPGSGKTVIACAVIALFAALVEDKKRTSQICRDVHQALQAGRTSLILTQRVSHIEAIVDELEQLGAHPLVLKGGMGKKARAEVADALSNRDGDNGLALVATGSYIGEGFDWPDLDTLFLAFPVAFKGRVVQYVGRLLRSHEGKHHVELHDYVTHEYQCSNACTPNACGHTELSDSTYPPVRVDEPADRPKRSARVAKGSNKHASCIHSTAFGSGSRRGA